jgi:hypothetical protein
MPHCPKPFFLKFRLLWYLQIDRHQVNLGPDRDVAFTRYRDLMAVPQVIVAGGTDLHGAALSRGIELPSVDGHLSVVSVAAAGLLPPQSRAHDR